MDREGDRVMEKRDTSAGPWRGKVAVTTLGCRVNQYDSSAIEDRLTEEGFSTVPFSPAADAYIINTCTVTGRTDNQSRQLIRMARRMNPSSIVIVTGCYAQVSPRDVAAIEGVDYILGNPEKDLAVECIKKGRPPSGPVSIVGQWQRGVPLGLRAAIPRARTRANLKVQDGCDMACSYCAIPMARGFSKSVAHPDILREIEALVERGFREIILTGVHLGAYGADLSPKLTLAALVREIEKRNYPCRFRLSSLDPDEVTDELIEILAGASSVCNHLHLPLQSGDDGILKLMRRPYTAGRFRDTVLKLHEKVRGISIGADVMAGFPGEGEEEFANTYNLIRDLPVSYLHIFPYSRRKGTPASAYPFALDPGEIRTRCDALRELDGRKREEFYASFLSEEMDVLVEGRRDRKTGLLKGRTRNYIPVLIEGDDGLKTREVKARLYKVTETGVAGWLAVEAGWLAVETGRLAVETGWLAAMPGKT
ncbi:MAG: tRNA (N(6)-L-threonylcarbamoyladenosine(37)-C(2))-methylthiotransferase MtaB [Deltaproteobacteria bacterium]|nr:tRNA (N(6)-L-threonylcarbamoyladenosine(37)-C(2))-methylthiotransferase MtaB [Deltaproteobacteria bacterium]